MKNEEKQQKNNMIWAEKAGILSVEDPQRVVTYEELAGILYRTLEYFFARLIAAVEDR